MSFLLAMVVVTSVVSAQDAMQSKVYFKGEKISGLICDGTMNIQLTENPSATGVFLDLPESAISSLTIDKTEDDYVRIKFGNDLNKIFKSRITIQVTVSNLKYMKLSGATSVIAKGKFSHSKEVTISMEGSSASADYLNIEANDVKIDLAGMTKMEEATINTASFQLLTSGTGPKVTVVDGKAAKGKIETTGAGRSNIGLVNFPIDELNANITGLSLVKANVKVKATVNVANGASFRYMGLGNVEGTGNIKPL